MLTLESINPISEFIELNGEKQTVDLTYEEPLLDATYGRPPANKTAVLHEVLCPI